MINNRWLILRVIISQRLWVIFLRVYSISTIIIIKTTEKLIKKNLIKESKFWVITIIVGNLGGLPPITIFWGKILVLKKSLRQSIPRELCFTLIIRACIFLFNYIIIVNNGIIIGNKKTTRSITNKNKHKKLTRIIAMLRVLTIAITIRLNSTKKDLP